MAHRAAEDPAQDVAPPLVARVDAVRQQEAHRPGVVGEHAIGRAVLRVAIVRHADQLTDAIDQRLEDVGMEVVVLALHHRCDPLESRARVHGRLRQRREGAVSRAVELHEDEVPDLEEPAFLGEPLELRLGDDFVRLSAGPPLRPLEIHIDLTTRPARPRVAHLPEVVLVPQPVDAVVGETGNVPPVPARLVVGMVDGHPEPLGGDAKPLGAGYELPGVRDRVPLEVVAEGEVAQHLEEGVVPLGMAHLLEIVVLAAGADALLARRGAGVLPVLLAEEGALELHHAGVGEQEGGIVRGYQRRRRHLAVPLGDEEVEK